MKRLILALLLVSGCEVTLTQLEGPPAALKIGEGSSAQILLGQYHYPEVLVEDKVVTANVYAKVRLEVTNGSFSCKGETKYQEKSVTQVNLPIQCNDGSNGSIAVVLNQVQWRINQSGVGVGKLNNGKKLRLLIGPLSGRLEF